MQPNSDTPTTPTPPDAKSEDDVGLPPTIEIPFGEALETLMDKPDYTNEDIKSMVLYARKRRQEQAAREIKLKSDAALRAEKKILADEKKKAKADKLASKSANEGIPTT